MTEEERPATTLRENLEELARIVGDIAKMTPKLKSISNLMLFEAMKKSLDEMTAEQNRLITAIVARSPDGAAKVRFEKSRARVETLEAQVQVASDMAAIEALGQEMNDATDSYSAAFQDLVRGIVEAQRSSAGSGG